MPDMREMLYETYAEQKAELARLRAIEAAAREYQRLCRVSVAADELEADRIGDAKWLAYQHLFALLDSEVTQ